MFSRPNRLFKLFILLTLLVLPCAAFAYLDPGTGSYLFQVLIASFLGALYAVKIYWRKILSFFGRKKAAAPAEPATDTTNEQEIQNEAATPESPEPATQEQES